MERIKGERFPYPSVSFLVIAASFLARATLRLWSEFVCYFWITTRGRVGGAEDHDKEEKRRDVVVGSWVCSEKMWKVWKASEYVLREGRWQRTERVKGGFVRCWYKFVLVLERIADTYCKLNCLWKRWTLFC